MSIWTAEEAVLLLTGESSLLPMAGAGVLTIVILGVDGKSQGSHSLGMAARSGSRGEESVVVKSLVAPHVEQIGRVVVITSAGRGIDEKTARALAHLGAYVAMAVFSTSRRHLQRAVHERYRILTGDLRREFPRMRELLNEMLQPDGGVMISMETVRDNSLVRS